MNPKPIALIFSTVWPEPQSSAAGVRQLQWVRWLNQLNYRVFIASPSHLKPELNSLAQGQFELLPLPLNQSWVHEKLKELNPGIVVFDRFILEEQFGHFVYSACPDSLVLLETQDLHFVRRVRDGLRENFLNLSELPPKFYQTETALRETASILRVDHAVVVSSFEENLLHKEFQIPASQISWVPFSYEEPLVLSATLPFAERTAFVWIGNFRHAPNLDGLRWFRKAIWPRIRTQIKGARIHVYGAYPNQEVMEWNDPDSGFRVLGEADGLDTVFPKARVNLAPLRFGAGVKGKILEGFRYALPCVTTGVGAEGLLPLEKGEPKFPGLIANDEAEFAQACTELYESEEAWKTLSKRAEELMRTHYGPKVGLAFQERILQMVKLKQDGVLPTWHSQVLRQELTNSRKYFSKWIEEKESKVRSSGPQG